MTSEQPPLTWEDHFGEEYSPAWKNISIVQILKRFDKEQKVGSVILDIGAGAEPISLNLQGILKWRRKFITVDIASQEQNSSKQIDLKFDIEKLPEESLTTLKSLVKTARFLGIKNPREAKPAQIDSMILSDILNYVDYKSVIKSLDQYLKPSGRMFIFNLDNRGFKHLFSNKRPKDNKEIIGFMGNLGYYLEFIEDPRWAPNSNQCCFVMKKG